MPAGRPSADGEVIRFEVDVYVLEIGRSRKHEAVAKLMLIDDVGTLVVGPRRPRQGSGAPLPPARDRDRDRLHARVGPGRRPRHEPLDAGPDRADQPDHGRASSPATSAGASS
jgi:hypothetical protein